MKPKKLVLLSLITFACILFLPMVFGTIIYDIIVPVDYYETTGTSVLFNWSTNSTSPIDNPMPSYLFINANESNELQYYLNQTIRYCLNYSSGTNYCNVTVTGFVPGYYQWKVVTGEVAVAPTVMSTNAYPFDTRDRSANVTSSNAETYDTRDRAANITSSNAEPFDTRDRAAVVISTKGPTYNTSAGNDTVDLTYTNGSGTAESCNVTLEQHNTLPIANVTSAFNSACNLTAAGTGNFTLTTENIGISYWIDVDSGNASGVLGLVNGNSYNGTVNNTLNIRYTNGTVEETCNVSLTKSAGLATSDAIVNMTQASASCNLTIIDIANINVNSIGAGSGEWIIFETGTANSIIGFTTDLNVTGSANNTVGLNYTVAGATTKCEVSLAKSATLSSSDAFDNITAVCDLQGNGDTYVNLNTNSTGINEFIIFANGSALGLLGFTVGVNYTGTVNNTLDLTYSVNGTAEVCNVSLTKDSQWNTTDIITNMTQASNQCNLTLTNTTFLILNGSGYGEEEYITIASGSVLSILGLTVGTTYGSQINTTSDARWFEVQDSAPTSNHSLFRWINGSGFISMWLNKDTGDLSIAGKFSGNLSYGNISSDSFPSACPSGAITNLDGAICTDSWVDTLGETDSVIFNGGNVTNMSMINILPQSAAPGGAVEGDVYYDSDLDELCFYNATAWIGVITHGACT